MGSGKKGSLLSKQPKHFLVSHGCCFAAQLRLVPCYLYGSLEKKNIAWKWLSFTKRMARKKASIEWDFPMTPFGYFYWNIIYFLTAAAVDSIAMNQWSLSCRPLPIGNDKNSWISVFSSRLRYATVQLALSVEACREILLPWYTRNQDISQRCCNYFFLFLIIFSLFYNRLWQHGSVN